MRQLVRYESEEKARILGDALFADGIEIRVDDTRDGGWLVWVQNEPDVARAREIQAEYERDPGAPRFAAATDVARSKRKEREKAAAKERSETIRIRDRWAAQSSTSIGPVSVALILCSAVVAVLTRLDIGDAGASAFTFHSFTIVDNGRSVSWVGSGFDDILAGQVWRLITPIFLHGGFLHILFNMWWLKDLGSMIERLQSSWFLLAVVLVVAIVSNTAQWFVSQHPLFGGMSGINYALLGYIWIRSRVEPMSGYAISGMTVVWMLGWFVICFTGLVGAVANTAHTAGLVMGCLLALIVWKGPKWLRR